MSIQNEHKILKYNVEYCRHTVIYSPSKHEKTSLVMQTIAETKLLYASVDLSFAKDSTTISLKLVNGVASAASLILPNFRKDLNIVQKFFKAFKILVEINGYKFSNTSANTIDIIYEAFNSLSKLATSQNKTIVFYIDEFQNITYSENFRPILGAIRNIAQQTTHLSFIFSGSNQQLLSTLFNDSSMPLYLLCDRLGEI